MLDATARTKRSSIPIKHHITYVFATLLLGFIRGLKACAYVLKPMFRILGLVIWPIARVLSRFVILPIYSIFLMAKIRLERTVVSARGLVFFVFTNRYVSHVLLFAIAVGTVGSQLMTQQASAQDAGQNSLLYTLVTRGQEDFIEESISPGLALADVHHLGADTIQTMPGIDYDYESFDETPVDLGISGTIAIRPQSEFPALPSEETFETTEDPDLVVPTTPVTPRKDTETYVVKSGDTVASIARRYGVNVGTIQWANNLNRTSSIKPGDALRIPAASGVLYTVKRGDTIQRLAQLYGVDAARISASNHLSARATLSVGKEILIPDATPQLATTQTPTARLTATTPSVISPKVSAKVAVKPDIPLSRIRNKAVDVYQELADEKSDTREKPSDASNSTRSRLLWPTHLRVINQYWGYQHTGIDIDGDYTDPIYASDDGVVEQAGWNNGGYGLMILIDHGNGFRTRYAHASKMFVKAGDKVKRGQTIAMVGTTGRSTGTHLHYEVYVNGRRANPLTYIR